MCKWTYYSAWLAQFRETNKVPWERGGQSILSGQREIWGPKSCSQSKRHESALENEVRVCQMKRKGRRTPGNMNKTRRYTVCTCEPGTSEEWPRAQHTNYIEI